VYYGVVVYGKHQRLFLFSIEEMDIKYASDCSQLTCSNSSNIQLSHLQLHSHLNTKSLINLLRTSIHTPSHPTKTPIMPSLKSTLTVLALSLFSTTAMAGWAQFCNDDNCSEGCGAAVDLDNPGCLNQYNRRSIKFSGTISQDVNLVASPNPGCDCQNYCEETIQRAWTGVFDQRPSCFTLRDEAVSFFFDLVFLGCYCEMYADFVVVAGSIFPFPWCSALRCGPVLSLRRCVSVERVTACESGGAVPQLP
jgi:hypothetical protein